MPGNRSVEVGGDDLVEQDERVGLDLDQPRQHRRDLDPGEAPLARLRVAQPDRDRQAQRRDVRERVAGVDRERGQDREDLVEEPSRSAAWCSGIGRTRRSRCPRRRAPRGSHEHRRVLGDELAGRAARTAASCSAGRQAVGRQPRRRPAACWRRPATRTWKNSSRLLAKIARNLTRSSSGFRRPRPGGGRAR